MTIDRELWAKALTIYDHARYHGEDLSRQKLCDALQISDRLSSQILFAIENKGIIRFEPARIAGTKESILVLPDVHVPFYDELTLQVALEFGKRNNVTKIVLLGDFQDCYKISSFSRIPDRKISFAEELNIGYEILCRIRSAFPDAEILYKEGNHELRTKRYIIENAPELSDLLEDLLPEKLHLKDLKIDYMVNHFQIGKLWFYHGHEIPCRGSNAEHICNIVFRHTNDHAICGHWHRKQDKSFKKISGEFYGVHVVGGLFGPQDYSPINQWTNGFAHVEIDEAGNFCVHNFHVINGEIFT